MVFMIFDDCRLRLLDAVVLKRRGAQDMLFVRPEANAERTTPTLAPVN